MPPGSPDNIREGYTVIQQCTRTLVSCSNVLESLARLQRERESFITSNRASAPDLYASTLSEVTVQYLDRGHAHSTRHG